MEQTTRIDREKLALLLEGALASLQLHEQEVDALNVFPVPDGDTGANMRMTVKGGVDAAAGKTFADAAEFTAAFARGTLLGARGNSGVILSQFFKGFSLGVQGKESLNAADFSFAFQEGVKKAYEAVINPTEGTMLTVMREGGECLQKQVSEQPEAAFEELLERLNRTMRESLAHTPEQLSVLKEAGVVDSGGAGFLYLFQGIEQALRGEAVSQAAWNTSAPLDASASSQADLFARLSEEDFAYGYCTEFILQLQEKKVSLQAFSLQQVIAYLESVGESIVAVCDEDLVKVHVHTFRPGDVLSYCQQFGEYLSVKIENMALQHSELLAKEDKKRQPIAKPIGIVAALTGEGLQSYFREIGADVIVEGGQTKNPSTEDFLEAFARFASEHILVLPCNNNVMMAAQQAADMYEKAQVRVIAAKTVAEGYAALSMMNLSLPADKVVRDMEAAVAQTTTGLITTATRDVDYADVQVKKGHFIGLTEERVLADSADRLEAVRGLLEACEGIRDKAVVVCFYGAAVGEEDVAAVEALLRKDFSWLEYGFIEGGQDVYDYIFSIE